MFTQMQEAVDWIEHSKRFTDKTDLVRMSRLCQQLNHPERAFRSVHVGGTNGKGSTCCYMKNILQEVGFKVGLYTSPYVVSINERIGINDEIISDANFIKYANILRTLWDEYFETYQDSITFFEILTLMAFLYFRDQKVEYAVIEVGLGGLLDATNVITPEVSVITNISFDHMKQLGNTLESIAYNKLGIVKPKVPLVTAEEKPDLIAQFQRCVEERESTLTQVDKGKITQIQVGETTSFTYRNKGYQLRLTGAHQVKNACLAIEAVQMLKAKKKISLTERNIYNGLYRTTWPGRFEIFNHQIILDGGHNPGAIDTVHQTIKTIYKGYYVKCLFAMMKDKDYASVLPKFEEFVDELHLTQIDYHRCATAQELYDECRHEKKYLHENVEEAFKYLQKSLKDHEVLLVCGSLYLISEIRKLLVKSK
jgi:dihydrofolate synthase/folylpolyglutamate synthase